jgi:hypothetical protein
LAQANTHESADTDTATSALHHTIGTGANNAAAGNHTHSYPGRIADGQSGNLSNFTSGTPLNIAYSDILSGATATYWLLDIIIVAAAGGTMAIVNVSKTANGATCLHTSGTTTAGNINSVTGNIYESDTTLDLTDLSITFKVASTVDKDTLRITTSSISNWDVSYRFVAAW